MSALTLTPSGLLIRQAKNLDEIYHTLSPAPLRAGEEMQAFYVSQLNEVRGGDKVLAMERGLRRAYGSPIPYKSFFMGHSGVGKSTEINRLEEMVKDSFLMVRINAPTDLNATSFRPFDVLLVAMMKTTEKMIDLKNKGEVSQSLPENLLKDIKNWFATSKFTTTNSYGTTASISAGIKPTPLTDTIAALLGFFVELKGEVKYSSDRKEEVIAYGINSIGSLITLLNRLLENANAILQKKNREIVLVGEDFDKPGMPPELVEALYLNYANIFTDLNAHILFNIPIWLAYSDKEAQLPLQKKHCINDTPVFNQQHLPHLEGRAAVKAALEQRISPTLFAEGQQERIIVASGGNLTDLFTLTAQAADTAALREGKDGKIRAQDVNAAISDLRTRYRTALGSHPYEKNPIPYEQKAKRLISVYAQEEGHDVPDPILHSLLRSKAVQEFNGERWFGVHPLVVDTLIRHGKLQPSEGQPVRGGTDA